MASITASTPTSSLPRVGLRPNGGTVGTSSAILGKIFLFSIEILIHFPTPVFALVLWIDDWLQGCR